MSCAPYSYDICRDICVIMMSLWDDVRNEKEWSNLIIELIWVTWFLGTLFPSEEAGPLSQCFNNSNPQRQGLTLTPDLLHIGIGDIVAAGAHEDIFCQQVVDHGLDLLRPHLTANCLGVRSDSLC